MELWPCGFKIEYTHLGSSLTWHLKLWPCGFEIDYTHLSFALAAAVPLGSDGDPGCIFFTLNTCQATFISDILWNDCRKSKKNKSVTYGRTDVRTDVRTYGGTDGHTDGRTDRREVWNNYLDYLLCSQGAGSNFDTKILGGRRWFFWDIMNCGNHPKCPVFSNSVNLYSDFSRKKWFHPRNNDRLPNA